jgi:hypothetical protein
VAGDIDSGFLVIEKTWADYVPQHTNLPGAREAFEQDCKHLLEIMHPYQVVQGVKVSQGDGGIDVFIGEFSAGPLTVYQCKFFETVGDAQKNQIRESFRRASESDKFTVGRWVLCMPNDDFTLKEHKWWSDWKVAHQQATGIEIELLNGSSLLTLFKQHGLYERIFGLQDSLRLVRIEEKVTRLLDGAVVEAVVPPALAVAPLTTPTFDPQQFRLLFTPEYTLDYEPYYVPRVSDEVLEQHLLSPKNIWLYGASGLGKTCLATRTLLQRQLPHVYCYLSALPNPREVGAVLQLIAEDVAEKYPGPLGQFAYQGANPIRQLARLLAHCFPTEDFIICIDEVPIDDPVVFGEFVEHIAAVGAEYRHCRVGAGNVRFIVATIQPPAPYHRNIAKFQESFTLLELPAWEPSEIDCLLASMHRAGELLTPAEQALVRQACRSPRTAKDIVHQYALNYRHQTLPQVVAHQVAASR